METLKNLRATTVLAVLRDGKLALGCDGQVTLGETVLKDSALKIRTMDNGKVLAGFAGSVADALNLFEKFESKLEMYSGNLTRAAVELAREWRLDKIMKNLEAILLVGDREHVYLVSGNGEVIETDDGILAIGSGGQYATAAARALYQNTDLEAKDIVFKSLNIAGEICIYTNKNIRVEELA